MKRSVRLLHSSNPLASAAAKNLETAATGGAFIGQQFSPLVNSASELISEVDSFGTEVDTTRTVFLLDASVESLPLRMLATRHGGVQWYLDYFVRPDPRYQCYHETLGSIAGCDRCVFSQEVRTAQRLFFTTERAAIAAQSEVGLSARNCSVLPFPISLPARRVPNKIGEVKREVRIAFCGRPAIEYRILSLLRASEQLAVNIELHWMGGEEERAEAEFFIREFPRCRLHFYPRRSVSVWQEILSTAHAVFFGSESAFEELLPYLYYGIAQGIPCCVSAFASLRDLPDAVVYKISPGINEGNGVRRFLEGLLDGKIPSCDATNNAQQFINDLHNPKEIAELLMCVLDSGC